METKIKQFQSLPMEKIASEIDFCRSGSPTIGMCMVRGGMGVAFLPSEEFSTHRVDGVAEVRLREPIVKEVGITWRRDAASPLVKTLREFAAAWCERKD